MARLIVAIGSTVLAVAALAQASGPAKADETLRRSKFVNLGMFAGYVVACGVASEAEADAMVSRVGAGLGDAWAPEDAARFEKARRAGRKSKCPKELKSAVERGWTNYRDVK